MKNLSMITAAMLAVVLLGLAGCSKSEPEQTPPPEPQPVAAKKIDFPPPTNLPVAQTGAVPVTPTPAAVAAPEDSPEMLADQIKQFETDYQNTPDFQKRVVIIYNLSAVESPDTIDAIGRLFLGEKDKELKIELVNSLMDVDGQSDKKLAILSTAFRADQPKDVRLEAIDGMGDTEDKRAIQILQGMANDPDEDIRDAIKDTIDQLQTDVAQPTAPTQGFTVPAK